MQFRVLGPVGAWRHDTEVTLDGAKQRTVLAALLLARGQSVSTSRLCELLWGQRPPKTYPAQIHTYISRLRRYLGGAATVVRRVTGYLLDIRDGNLDLDDFERLVVAARSDLAAGNAARAAQRLRTALSLWRGPALSNVTEHLAGAEGHRVDELRLGAIDALVTTELALGHHGRLVAELTRLVAEYPLHEALRAHLMTALVRCGRPADAQAVYHEGRRLLADELGLEPSQELSSRYREILAPAAGEGSLARPAMLPQPLPDFTDRHAELAWATAALRSDTGPATLLLTGPAGVGKSALALHAVHQCRDSFPGGQLYADLGASRGQTVPAGDVLDWFLRSLGLADPDIPTALAQREALYRSHIAQRRILVVLDDARSYADIRPLLPGDHGSRVVVTARPIMPELAGAGVLDLGPLDRNGALALLGAIAGPQRVAAEPAAAAAIADLCGRLPLALRIAGARLRGRPHWSLADMAGRLGDEARRLDELRLGDWDVRAGIAASYQALPALARRALRRLSLVDNEALPAATITVLASGLAADRAADQVADTLADAHLLEVVPGPRYRPHELVRVFARCLADPDDYLAVVRLGAVVRP